MHKNEESSFIPLLLQFQRLESKCCSWQQCMQKTQKRIYSSPCWIPWKEETRFHICHRIVMKMAGSRTTTTPNTAMIIVSVFLFELRFTVPINPCQQKDYVGHIYRIKMITEEQSDWLWYLGTKYVGDQVDHEKHSLKTSRMLTNKKLCKWTEARLW